MTLPDRPAAIGAAAVAAVMEAVLKTTADPSQSAALAAFLRLLQRWNATHNLTALRDPAQILSHHLGDCLAAWPPLRQYLGAQGGRRVLDVGSGGGLPGAIFAIVAPALDVTCIDAAAKKAAFVRHVAGELSLRNLHAAHGRVEALGATPPYDVIVARAFAPLGEFVALTQHLVAPGGAWLAMKGRAPDDEAAALPPFAEVFHVKPLRVPGLDAQRCLVWMRKR